MHHLFIFSKIPKNGPLTRVIITPKVAILGTIAKYAVTIVGAPA
jgi:hypothetical protein